MLQRLSLLHITPIVRTLPHNRSKDGKRFLTFAWTRDTIWIGMKLSKHEVALKKRHVRAWLQMYELFIWCTNFKGKPAISRSRMTMSFNLCDLTLVFCYHNLIMFSMLTSCTITFMQTTMTKNKYNNKANLQNTGISLEGGICVAIASGVV